jgi:hypothetical protein
MFVVAIRPSGENELRTTFIAIIYVCIQNGSLLSEHSLPSLDSGGERKMKGLIIGLLMVFSLSAYSNTRDSVSRAERKIAKMERKAQKQRVKISHQWDERTMRQRRVDRHILLFLAVGVAVLVNTVSKKE